MKKLATSLAMFTALTAAATAADLPRRAPPPVFTPVPVFTWTGFYAGLNAGYGFGVQDSGIPTVVGTVDRRVIATGVVPGAGPGAFFFPNGGGSDGFVGGGQIGYNYQFTPGSGVVIGIEADAQYADLGGRFGRAGGCGVGGFCLGGTTLQPGVTIFNPTGLQGLDFFGTARGRIGYAVDRVLFYATGGFAYGSFGGGRAINADDFKTGWTVGGGVEYALPTDSFLNFFRSSAVTLKVEGLYVNFDGQNRLGYANANGVIVNASPVGGAGVTSVILQSPGRRDNDFAVVRAGLNYKFGTY